MPKIKMHKSQPHIDMTPMVDLFFLLLTFFMLTTSFRAKEAALIDTPNSVSEKQAPEMNVMTLFIDKDGKFFNLDNGVDTTRQYRKKVLLKMADKFGAKFTAEELKRFSLLTSFGMPFKDIKKWIMAEGSQKDQYQTGVPIDSTNNELAWWIFYTRETDKEIVTQIKGDAKADYKAVKTVLDILQEKNVNKFNLTTNLEGVEVKIDEYKK